MDHQTLPNKQHKPITEHHSVALAVAARTVWEYGTTVSPSDVNTVASLDFVTGTCFHLT